eukprot:jgi/Chlat1/7294/Chrsp58S06920
MAGEQGDEISALFPIFLLSVLSLFLVPWTIVLLLGLASGKHRAGSRATCSCSMCRRSPKNAQSVWRKVNRYLTVGNVACLLLWCVAVALMLYIRASTAQVTPFEPYSILGLSSGASESDIKKAYRRLSLLYHPDKNPDPAATQYFTDYISKAYKALTDETMKKNLEEHGHPDGPQGYVVGIALPKFMLQSGANGGALVLCLVGCGILLPLIAAVVYLTKSSKYAGNQVMQQTMTYYHVMMKPSLALSKVIEHLMVADEYVSIPVRRTDEEPLQRLANVLRGELAFDPSNLKTQKEKFWRRHPALIKAQLLLLAQMSRESAQVDQGLLQQDMTNILQLAPKLMEELFKAAVRPRPPLYAGWLRPAQSVLEVSQCLIQGVPLSLKKLDRASASGMSGADGPASLMQLPHVDSDCLKQLGRKKVRGLADLQAWNQAEREAVYAGAGISAEHAADIEATLAVLPEVTLEATVETEGESMIEANDIVTLNVWVKITRPGGGPPAGECHSPLFPFVKEEGWYLMLVDPVDNSVFVSQKVLMDSDTPPAGAEASKLAKEGYRLTSAKFQAPKPSDKSYNLQLLCMSDCWIGCDRKLPIKMKVNKPGTRGPIVTADGEPVEDEVLEKEGSDADQDEIYDEDDESEGEESDDEDSEPFSSITDGADLTGQTDAHASKSHSKSKARQRR